MLLLRTPRSALRWSLILMEEVFIEKDHPEFLSRPWVFLRVLSCDEWAAVSQLPESLSLSATTIGLKGRYASCVLSRADCRSGFKRCDGSAHQRRSCASTGWVLSD